MTAWPAFPMQSNRPPERRGSSTPRSHCSKRSTSGGRKQARDALYKILRPKSTGQTASCVASMRDEQRKGKRRLGPLRVKPFNQSLAEFVAWIAVYSESSDVACALIIAHIQI